MQSLRILLVFYSAVLFRLECILLQSFRSPRNCFQFWSTSKFGLLQWCIPSKPQRIQKLKLTVIHQHHANYAWTTWSVKKMQRREHISLASNTWMMTFFYSLHQINFLCMCHLRNILVYNVPFKNSIEDWSMTNFTWEHECRIILYYTYDNTIDNTAIQQETTLRCCYYWRRKTTKSHSVITIAAKTEFGWWYYFSKALSSSLNPAYLYIQWSTTWMSFWFLTCVNSFIYLFSHSPYNIYSRYIML